MSKKIDRFSARFVGRFERAIAGIGGTSKPDAGDIIRDGDTDTDRDAASDLRAHRGFAARGATALWPLVVAALTLSSAPTQANEPPEALSEDQAVALALRDNPDLRAFRKGRAVAEGEVISAMALQNPSLRLDLMHLQESDPSRLGFGVGLEWKPPQPVEWLARRDQARAQREVVRQEIAEREWAVASAARIAHVTVRELGEQARLLDAAVALRRRVADLVKTRLRHGDVTRLELNLAELAVLRARRELDDCRLRAVQAQAQLKALTGIVDEAPLTLAGHATTAPEDDAAADPAALAAQALSARPSLRAAQARIDAQAQVLRAERTRRWPWLQVAGRYRHNDASGYPRDGQLSVDLTLPLLDQNRGPIRVAQAQQELLRAEADAKAAALRQRVYAACAELALRRDILRRHRDEVLPVLEEHERLMAAAIRGAQVDLVALLSAEESVLRDRREHAEARLLYRQAQLALWGTVAAQSAGTKEQAP